MYKSKLVNIKEFMKILNNLSPDYQIRAYHKKKKGSHPGVITVKKPTLSQKLDELTEQMNSHFHGIEKRLDRVEIRLDNVEKRLDYINLKKLPNSR